MEPQATTKDHKGDVPNCGALLPRIFSFLYSVFVYAICSIAYTHPHKNSCLGTLIAPPYHGLQGVEERVEVAAALHGEHHVHPTTTAAPHQHPRPHLRRSTKG